MLANTLKARVWHIRQQPATESNDNDVAECRVPGFFFAEAIHQKNGFQEVGVPAECLNGLTHCAPGWEK